jgi:hypothetical protein
VTRVGKSGKIVVSNTRARNLLKRLYRDFITGSAIIMIGIFSLNLFSIPWMWYEGQPIRWWELITWLACPLLIWNSVRYLRKYVFAD